MDSSHSIREARSDEAELIRDFQVAMAAETEGMRLDPEGCLLGVKRVFSDPRCGQYFVMEAAHGSAVGCALVQTEWSDWRNRAVLWIHSLYVRPEFRGHGFTRAFYEMLQTRVKHDPNLGGLRLYVDKTNTRAISVYEKFGMTREHYALYEWMK